MSVGSRGALKRDATGGRPQRNLITPSWWELRYPWETQPRWWQLRATLEFRRLHLSIRQLEHDLGLTRDKYGHPRRGDLPWLVNRNPTFYG